MNKFHSIIFLFVFLSLFVDSFGMDQKLEKAWLQSQQSQSHESSTPISGKTKRNRARAQRRKKAQEARKQDSTKSTSKPNSPRKNKEIKEILETRQTQSEPNSPTNENNDITTLDTSDSCLYASLGQMSLRPNGTTILHDLCMEENGQIEEEERWIHLLLGNYLAMKTMIVLQVKKKWNQAQQILFYITLP